MNSIIILQNLYSGRINRGTQEVLNWLTDPARENREKINRQLEMWRNVSEPTCCLGNTLWGETVCLPFSLLKAHGLCGGATGAGKSYTGLLILNESLKHSHAKVRLVMGSIDGKGEYHRKALDYLYVALYRMDPKEAEQLRKKIMVMDFSDPNFITPYNILAGRGESAEYLVNDRLETISGLFPGNYGLSPRMRNTMKMFLLLLADAGLPITAIELALNEPSCLDALVQNCHNTKVRSYFKKRYAQEGRGTIAAVWQRLESLFVSEGVRLSLSTQNAPDFAGLQDDGNYILINTSGPHISRSTSEFLLRIIISDIRQSIFRRKRPEKPYVWLIDEFQTLSRTAHSRENLNDILTLARSFGCYFILMTQSLSSAVRDKEILNSIQTNVGWIIMFRATRHDAGIMTPALDPPQVIKSPRSFGIPEKNKGLMTPAQAVMKQLENFEKLPPRLAYVWAKGVLDSTFPIRTADLKPPHEIAGCEPEVFENYCASHPLGNQLPRSEVIREKRKIYEKIRPKIRTKKQSAKMSAQHPGGHKVLLEKLKKEYAQKRGDVEK